MATGVFDSCDWRKDGTRTNTHGQKLQKCCQEGLLSVFSAAERVLLRPSLVGGGVEHDLDFSIELE